MNMAIQDPSRPLPPLAPAPPGRRMLPGPVRWLLLALALVCLALGIVGIFLPVLPTVPFVLLAAWAASLSSPRLSRWLDQHPHFGKPLNEWRRHGVVRRRAKWAATVAMAVSATASLVLLGAHWAALLAVACMACVLAWLWRRPEQPAD
ncbi:MAG: YbaN family protein [Polaromonas sp.]